MSEPTSPAETAPATPADFHREIAQELFRQVLALTERTDRTCAEDDRMVHAAHASRFHWEFAGNTLNLALGEWQCARVHTLVRQRDAALHYAWNYLEMAESYGLGDFHLAHAHLTVAGALGPAKTEDAQRHLATARDLLETLTSEEEIKLLQAEIQTTTQALQPTTR